MFADEFALVNTIINTKDAYQMCIHHIQTEMTGEIVINIMRSVHSVQDTPSIEHH